ncbi:MAG: hypothetical protein C4581_13260 [Nitrospiraceae bacterium]|nr:MAG: hypothetical protein C4581_13260 [Nitrospiraceae bacterium]
MTKSNKRRFRIKKKFGIVGMLDALGVKNRSIDEALEFTGKIRLVQEGLQTMTDSYFKVMYGKSSEPQFTEILDLYKNSPPHILTFGDTVLFTWELPDTNSPYPYLIPAADLLSFAICIGLDHELLFRGAFTFGEYIQDETVVAGPAIADVASWYEESDWFGIIATPYCSQFISYMDQQKNKFNETLRDFFNETFIYYDVPMKDAHTKKLWALAWPRLNSYIHTIESINTIDWYYNQLQALQIPKGTEAKYMNTEKFLMKTLDKDVYLK